MFYDSTIYNDVVALSRRLSAQQRDERSTTDGEALTVSVSHHPSAAIHQLAALTASTAPGGPLLLAEVDGEPVAAVGLVDGRLVTRPGRAGAELISFMRAWHLGARMVLSIWGA
jgi:hypothetical protein